MGTPFDNIIDLALVTIRDYKIDKLFSSDLTAFKEYMDGFLVRAVPLFTECIQSLDYDLTSRTFNSTLTNLEQNILSDYVVMTWFASEVQNVTQFNMHLDDSTFKHYSEAENLKQKSEYLDRLREKVKQSAQEYQFANLASFPYFSGN